MSKARMADPNISGLSRKHEIETELHARLDSARTEYELVKVAVVPSASETEQGCRHTLENAFETYRRELDAFNRFILYGDLPPRPD